MGPYILIIFLATSSYDNSGSAGISQEFHSKKACLAAGEALVNSAHNRGSYVMAWGCYSKG